VILPGFGGWVVKRVLSQSLRNGYDATRSFANRPGNLHLLIARLAAASGGTPTSSLRCASSSG